MPTFMKLLLCNQKHSKRPYMQCSTRIRGTATTQYCYYLEVSMLLSFHNIHIFQTIKRRKTNPICVMNLPSYYECKRGWHAENTDSGAKPKLFCTWIILNVNELRLDSKTKNPNRPKTCFGNRKRKKKKKKKLRVKTRSKRRLRVTWKWKNRQGHRTGTKIAFRAEQTRCSCEMRNALCIYLWGMCE